jgi:hypothetical protein
MFAVGECKDRANPRLAGALAGVTAAVVGVIANLAFFFALHTLFDDSREIDAGPIHVDLPVLSAWDPVAFAITGVALAMMFFANKGVVSAQTPRNYPYCELEGKVGSLESGKVLPEIAVSPKDGPTANELDQKIRVLARNNVFDLMH